MNLQYEGPSHFPLDAVMILFTLPSSHLPYFTPGRNSYKLGLLPPFSTLLPFHVHTSLASWISLLVIFGHVIVQESCTGLAYYLPTCTILLWFSALPITCVNDEMSLIRCYLYCTLPWVVMALCRLNSVFFGVSFDCWLALALRCFRDPLYTYIALAFL